MQVFLKKLGYQQRKLNNWYKPFATTLLVMDYKNNQWRLTQWFIDGNGNPAIWNSDIINSDASIRDIQLLEASVCREAFVFTNTECEKLIPELNLEEYLNTIL